MARSPLLDPGHVRSMRGLIVNMHELRTKAKRPIQLVDAKDKVHLRHEPVKTKNIRGFVPSLEGVSVRSGSKQEKSAREIPVVLEEDLPTMADMTGVIIEKRPGIKKPEDSTVAAQEILASIIDNIPKGRKLDDVPRRRAK